MHRQKAVVYAGPTISPAEIQAVLPGAEVRPPVARGDLLAGDWHPGDVAVIVDGYFRERPSVGHKEILWLLGNGVDVVGAASMGALRAAELGPYGMRGVGAVYGMYASGEIDGDDEVGVLHGPAEMGYPARTVALVNLRYGCREGAAAGLLPAEAGQRIVAAAKALPFMFRNWPDIERLADDGDRNALRTLRRMIGSGRWDLKRRDAAEALLAAGRRDAAATGPAAARVPFTGIIRSQVLARQSRREYAPGRWMSDLTVLDAGRLFDGEYRGQHEDVLTGMLADLAARRGMTVMEYARAKLCVDGRSPLPAGLASWLTEAELAHLTPSEQIRLVMVRVWPVWQSADWRPAVLARLRESGRWSEWAGVVARADEAAEQTRHRLVVPPPAVCAKVFLRHWRQPGSSPEIEMARRGFSGLEELGGAVQRFFAYDVQRAKSAR